MSTTRYVALLRGINVGGRNKVAMAGLRDVFAAHGFTSVSTYIQSGNVLFAAAGSATSLEATIEAMLQQELGLPVMVVVRSSIQVRRLINAAPPGFGIRPDLYHSDAVFLKAPLTPARTMEIIELRDGVDAAWPGRGVVYFQRLSERRSQSRLSRIIGTPEYALMTIRSWKTTLKVRELLDGRERV